MWRKTAVRNMTTGKQRFAKHMRQNYAGYLMLAPLFIGILVFCYFPPISGLRLAFFEVTSNTQEVFVGFDNFRALFRDEVFLSSIPTMFIIMIPKLVIGIVVPFIMAELLLSVRSSRMQSLYRILILLPIVAPGVVNLLIWRGIYDASSSGILNGILMAFGVKQPINWLGDENWVIFSIIFMGFPWVGGTSVLIYLSGLGAISGEMMEAARLDGAGTLRRIFSIDLPLLLGQIKYFWVFGLIGGFQDYGVQLILTEGGPHGTTYVPGYYLYIKVKRDDALGYASAIGVVLFAVIAIVTGLSLKFFKTDKTV